MIVLSRLEYEQVHLKYVAGLKVIVKSACKINCSLLSLDLYRKLQVVIVSSKKQNNKLYLNENKSSSFHKALSTTERQGK
jgi:hypothetical protein